MASIAAKPWMPWDCERFFYGNPYLSKTERSVAVLVLKSWDRDFQPVESKIASQTLLGYWAGCWRSTACRALRKLVALGWFRTTWISVNRHTKQGEKGVTRVQVTPGPELLKRIKPAAAQESPGQGHGVMSSHTSPPLQVGPVTVGSSEIANSADRSGERAVDNAEFKRKTLAEWPRLAGSKPISADRLPSAVPFADFVIRTDGAELGDDSAEEYAARLQARRRQLADAEAARLQAAEQRTQPRRRPPRSRR